MLPDEDETKEQLISELEGMRQRVAELEVSETERKRMEELARSRLELQRTISAISARFVRLADIDDAINKSLADIGKFSNASRSYLFLFREDGTTADNTHEWCAEGVRPVIENNQNIPTETLWWMAHIRQGELVQIEDVSRMPPEASAEKPYWKVRTSNHCCYRLPMILVGKLLAVWVLTMSCQPAGGVMTLVSFCA